MSSPPPLVACTHRPARGWRDATPVLAATAGLALAGVLAAGSALAATYPITPQQRATAQQVAEAGVPLSDLVPNAPDSHTVKPGDTLWDISGLFLKQPWRWPELWGMNLSQIRNPHLIYPGQVLVLEKLNGRARLRMGQAIPDETVKLSPRIRSQPVDSAAIASIPLNLIGPFLNQGVVLNDDQLANAARIVAAQEGRVLMSRGETAYVRGDLGGARSFALFREAKPLLDPTTREVLGYEAAFVGTAEFVRAEGTSTSGLPVPATVVLSSLRQEAGVGDRLVPVPTRDYSPYMPHAPAAPMQGQVVSIYGEALSAGQNQIVAINRGQRDGMERGHVLALWRAGARAQDRTVEGKPQPIQLPDERSGLLFVFRVFDRVSYALIVSATEPVKSGDRFSQP